MPAGPSPTRPRRRLVHYPDSRPPRAESRCRAEHGSQWGAVRDRPPATASPQGSFSALSITSLSRAPWTLPRHNALTWTYTLALDQLDAPGRVLRHMPGCATFDNDVAPRRLEAASAGQLACPCPTAHAPAGHEPCTGGAARDGSLRASSVSGSGDKIRTMHGPTHHRPGPGPLFQQVSTTRALYHQQTENLLDVPHAWFSDTAYSQPTRPSRPP